MLMLHYSILENFYLRCVTDFEALQPWEHVVNDCWLDAGNANCFIPCTQKVFLLPAVRTGSEPFYIPGCTPVCSCVYAYLSSIMP